MAAVRGGARHVQGTLNGLGERTGNANLTSIIPNLQLKQDYVCLPEGRMERLTVVSHRIAETLNRAVNPQAPYVGSSAFAHKAGLHVSAIVRAKDAYEHVNPELVGNGDSVRRVRDGRPGDDPDEGRRPRIARWTVPSINQVIDDLKRLEHEGYHFEAADASLELLMRRAAGWEHDFFRVESMRVITDELSSGAVHHRGDGQGVGRRGALRVHRRRATARSTPSTPPCGAADPQAYPQLANIHLTDYKVRILDGGEATGAVTRVLLSATDGEQRLDDDRRQPEHHRGVVAGARGERRLRPAPRSGRPIGCTITRPCAMAAPKSAPAGLARHAVLLVARRRARGRGAPIGRGWSTGSQPVGAAARHARPRPGICAQHRPAAAPDRCTSGRRDARMTSSRDASAIALRRASLFSRAPVVHDLRIAFTIWGYFDPEPPAELIARREELFEGVGNINHHYAEGRRIADMVPESTLRMTPQQVDAAYPAERGRR